MVFTKCVNVFVHQIVYQGQNVNKNMNTFTTRQKHVSHKQMWDLVCALINKKDVYDLLKQNVLLNSI